MSKWLMIFSTVTGTAYIKESPKKTPTEICVKQKPQVKKAMKDCLLTKNKEKDKDKSKYKLLLKENPKKRISETTPIGIIKGF